MEICWDLLSGASFLCASLPNSFSWRLYLQEDAHALNEDKRVAIELKIRELAVRLGLSKPIELTEIKGLSARVQAQGTAFLPGKAAIAINPERIACMSRAEMELALAHELSRIQANDFIWMGIVPLCTSAATTVAMRVLFPASAIRFSSLAMRLCVAVSPAAFVGLVVSYIALPFFSQWREACARRLSFSICSENFNPG